MRGDGRGDGRRGERGEGRLGGGRREEGGGRITHKGENKSIKVLQFYLANVRTTNNKLVCPSFFKSPVVAFFS